MHKGLTQATLGVLGAALLSGSVFAAGPTLDRLPTVIITDRHSEADVATLPSGSEYDFLTAATENIYRFTGAFDLADYVAQDPADTGDVRFVFTELDGGGVPLAGGARTIGINQVLGLESEPTYSDVASGQSVGVLDFVNEARTGSDGSTNLPGPDPGGAFIDSAVLKLFIASTDAATNQAVASDTFTVITTNDIGPLGTFTSVTGDTLSLATSIYTPELSVDDLAGWLTTISSGVPDFSIIPPTPFNGTAWNDWVSFYESAQPAVLAPTPNVSVPAFIGTVNVTGSPTPTLSISTLASPTAAAGTPAGFAPQFGAWGSGRRDLSSSVALPVTKGRAYVARWNVSGSSIPSTHVADVRFRMGEATTLGFGQQSSHMTLNSSNQIVGGSPLEHRSYFYAHEDGEILFLYDVFDFYTAASTSVFPNGHSNYTLTLDRLDVLSFNPADLGAGTVLLNHGGAVSLAAGEDAPPSGETGFNTTTVWGYQENENAGSANRQVTPGQSAGELSVTMTAGDGSAIATWDTLPFLLNSNTDPALRQEIITGVQNGKIVRVDFWISSPQGGTANNNLPIVRYGIQTDAWGPSGQLSPTVIFQGRTEFHTWTAWNRVGPDVGQDVNPVMALQTGDRRYSLFFEPNIRAAGADAIDFRPVWQAYSFPIIRQADISDPLINADPFMQGTVRVRRVVVTSYDHPPLP